MSSPVHPMYGPYVKNPMVYRIIRICHDIPPILFCSNSRPQRFHCCHQDPNPTASVDADPPRPPISLGSKSTAPCCSGVAVAANALRKLPRRHGSRWRPWIRSPCGSRGRETAVKNGKSIKTGILKVILRDDVENSRLCFVCVCM